MCDVLGEGAFFIGMSASLGEVAAVSQQLEVKNDLPERFGAMTVKELRQGLRRGMFVVPFIVIQLLAVVATLMEFYMGDVESYSAHEGVFNPALFLNSGVFWAVAGFVCVIIMPLGGLALMGQELEEGNHELLLMTPLTRWRVVRGKFLAMWGICLVTFVSLLPYLIVRYFIGGIDAWRNVIMALSVICASAVMCAGAIGASSFRTMLAKGAVLTLFFLSFCAAGLAPLMWSAHNTDGCGVLYHINALAFGCSYTLLGLALARSQIRLVVHNYEVKPSWMVLGLFVITPIVVSVATAMTLGYGGFLGLVGMGAVAWFSDVSPKAGKWVKPPAPNTPPAPTSS